MKTPDRGRFLILAAGSSRVVRKNPHKQKRPLQGAFALYNVELRLAGFARSLERKYEDTSPPRKPTYSFSLLKNMSILYKKRLFKGFLWITC